MYDIHLTPDDIARVTVVSSCGQLSELLFSLAVLCKRRGDLVYGAWAHDLSPTALQAARALSGLVSCPPPLDLITLTSQVTSLEDGIEAILQASAASLRAEIDEARPGLTIAPPRWIDDLPARISVRRGLGQALQGYDSALSPHWSRLRAYLDAQAAVHARVLARVGVQAFLQSLHSDLRWSPPTLTLTRTDLFGEIRAQGRGLVIMPVVFARRAGVFHSVVRPDEPIVVAVPAVRSIADAQAIWGTSSLPSSRALAALVGETRAAALAIISDSCTTSELARRLGISPATASHHATVLRSAGLVMTRRAGSAVVHTVTPLGAQLLDGRSVSH